jgi:hypothetical protein
VSIRSFYNNSQNVAKTLNEHPLIKYSKAHGFTLREQVVCSIKTNDRLRIIQQHLAQNKAMVVQTLCALEEHTDHSHRETPALEAEEMNHPYEAREIFEGAMPWTFPNQ